MPRSRYPSLARALGGLVLALVAALLTASPATANVTVTGRAQGEGPGVTRTA